MTNEEYRGAYSDLIYLAGCAVNGQKPDLARIGDMDLTSLHHAAEKHLLAGIIATALESAGVRDNDFAQSKAKAIRKVLLFDRERAVILHKLEEAGIWHMPLKGVILKDLYPMIGMREMADNDILCDDTRMDDVRTIMEGQGFTLDHSDLHHDVFLKPPLFNFEMHGELFGEIKWKRFHDYYKDVKSRLILDPELEYAFHFSEEDFYIYMITHEYKHFVTGGTGLRSLLDCYVYCKELGNRLDWSYIEGELNKLGIAEFEKQNRQLSHYLFSASFNEEQSAGSAWAPSNTDALTGEDREMLAYILSSGTYGTLQNRVENTVRRYGGGAGGKFRYAFSRLFPPLENIRIYHPVFMKIPVLLPFLPFYRAFRGITVKRSRLIEEIKALKDS